MKRYLTTYNLLWLVYILFLAVLMPHTAWAFAQFQSDKTMTNPMPWMLAFSVEAVIAAFTHKLAEHLTAKRKLKGVRANLAKWVNGYSVGLVMVLTISSISNLAYTVQFAGDLAVFTEWGISVGVYEFAFGAMLPFVSLVFALVLSQMAESEAETDPALTEANNALREVRLQLRESERARKIAEDRLNTVLDIAKMFAGDNKKERIVAISQRWPNLPNVAVAVLSESSPTHVSEVLKEFSKN
jgi:hypothetical protein